MDCWTWTRPCMMILMMCESLLLCESRKGGARGGEAVSSWATIRNRPESDMKSSTVEPESVTFVHPPGRPRARRDGRGGDSWRRREDGERGAIPSASPRLGAAGRLGATAARRSHPSAVANAKELHDIPAGAARGPWLQDGRRAVGGPLGAERERSIDTSRIGRRAARRRRASHWRQRRPAAALPRAPPARRLASVRMRSGVHSIIAVD